MPDARDLVMRYGWNTTCYQVLNPDLQHWYSVAGDALIGYVTHARVRVVAGAPVTPLDRFAAVAAEFIDDAHMAGERVCWFAAEEWFEEALQRNGRHARICLGAQPVWDPAEWAGRVAGNASLRAQLNRARNKLVTVEPWLAASGEQLQPILSAWLSTRGLPPMRFLLESDVLNRLGDRRVFVARSPTGLHGFLVASPVPARDGWLAELVVRSPDAPNGTAELLIDQAVRELQGRYFSLGLAPLSPLGGSSPDPLWLRALLAWMRAHGRRFYHFQGLEYFKAKFDPPQWKPVYALMPGASVSPVVLYAIGAAFAGGSPLAMLGRGLVSAAADEARTLFSGRASQRIP